MPKTFEYTLITTEQEPIKILELTNKLNDACGEKIKVHADYGARTVYFKPEYEGDTNKVQYRRTYVMSSNLSKNNIYKILNTVQANPIKFY